MKTFEIAVSRMTDLIIAQAFNGLVLGMIYVLLAMGLSIVWGMMDIISPTAFSSRWGPISPSRWPLGAAILRSA